MFKYDTQELKSVANIVDFLPTVPKRVGSTLSCKCPFHSEKTPSFTIYTDSNTFHCFGCAVHGDVFDLIMRLDSVDLTGACEVVATRYGIAAKDGNKPLYKPRPKASEPPVQVKEKHPVTEEDKKVYKRLYELNPILDDIGQQFLKAKGFTPETIDHFGWRTITDTSVAILQKEFTPDILERSGLFGKRGEGGMQFKFYYHRLLIPYFIDGELSYIRARSVEKAPRFKFVNLVGKDTQLYNYDALLGLTSSHKLYIAEGETDTMTLTQLGLIAVGLMGASQDIESIATVMTTGFGGDIPIVLCFDNDHAGDEAYQKNAKYLWRKGIRVQRKVIPPEYKDITDWSLNNIKANPNEK